MLCEVVITRTIACLGWRQSLGWYTAHTGHSARGASVAPSARDSVAACGLVVSSRRADSCSSTSSAAVLLLV